ncbi:MAG TPA: hypothetical protein VHW23_04450 [Kofleriaceae bacterium]|jgi:hypothetical protein|nr:hypothetical protein [Kofleriaceae bacterium]
MGKGDSPAPASAPAEDKQAAAKAAAAKPASATAVRTLAEARPARIAKSSTPPLTSRTATLDDPLTTSLLAEIARRPSTVEMSPEQLAAARAMAPDAPDAPPADDRDPDDPA